MTDDVADRASSRVPSPSGPNPRAAIILAAGHGTRMRSALPKVLHPIGGRPMLHWALALARGTGAERILLVAGAHSDAVRAEAAKFLPAGDIVIQDPPMGTGHAVSCGRAALAGFEGDAIVIFADTPLIPPETAERLFAAVAGGASVAVLGFRPADPGDYGRLVTGADGELLRIVEARDANAAEKQITLCNSGVLAAPAQLLFSLLGRVTNHNAKGEYYLTDIIGLAVGDGLQARVIETAAEDVLGVNSCVDLAAAEAVFQARKRSEMLALGVSLRAPDTVHFSFDTEIAPNVVVEPFVVFGPGVKIARGAEIRAFSWLEGAVVREGARVGPYARLRSGSDIGSLAHIGNFVEVKNVRIGDGAKANHLAYLGDGTVGAGANIGAGVVFCNYDGFDKYETHVGAGAFIGSDCALVAPVTIGAGAYTGSGSVITDDVPDDALALARGRQVVREEWALRFRAGKRESKG